MPHQAALPSTTVSADGAPTPMNDHRDHDRPFSADSRRKVPSRSPANFRYADNGVSESASTLRVTGTTRWSDARSRNSSSVVVSAFVVDVELLREPSVAAASVCSPLIRAARRRRPTVSGEPR
ncbi:Uncharacterised protein [Mycobacteroides abscessus subsp. abscessus]|nr:Uncharacterised protein [Mycobacteroides abscessus subsp. abscessus]